MSRKGFRYIYQMKSIYPQELEAVIFAYTQNGWKHIDDIIDDGPPYKIVFEWERVSPPIFPEVNWP